MDVLNAIESRRAVKHFDSEYRLSEDELRTLLAAAALAPTSFNMQNRQFVAVLDGSTKRALQEAAWGQEQVRDASVVVVVVGDLVAHSRKDRYLRNVPAAAREQLEEMIDGFYGGKPELLRDEACRSVGLAAMNLMLAARSLGYDSCPMIGFDPQRVSDVLGLDADHPPLMMVVIGRKRKEPHPRLGLLDLEEVVSIDRYGARSLAGEVDLTDRG